MDEDYSEYGEHDQFYEDFGIDTDSDSNNSKEDDNEESTPQAYLFEPEHSPEEIARRMAQMGTNPTEQTIQCSDISDSNLQGSYVAYVSWCTCSNCINMPTEMECVCCHRHPGVEMLRLTSVIEKNQCITFDEDFNAHINSAVLRTFFATDRINWSENHTPEGPNGELSNRQYRLAAYRHILEWFMQGEHLGAGNRMTMPACVVRAVRGKFPSEDGTYTGFQVPGQ